MKQVKDISNYRRSNILQQPFINRVFTRRIQFRIRAKIEIVWNNIVRTLMMDMEDEAKKTRIPPKTG